MEMQFHEHIANIVVLTRKFCARLAVLEQFTVVMRSVEHIERLKHLEASGQLGRDPLPGSAIALDAATVSVSASGRILLLSGRMTPLPPVPRPCAQLISKFCYNWDGVKWAKVVEFIRKRTGDERYTVTQMKALEFKVWRAVGFTLRPRAVNDAADTPLSEGEGPTLVVPIEKLERWQYEEDGASEGRAFRGRRQERMDRSLGWPVSIATAEEVAVLHHWLVSDFAALDLNC
jgi:hypothetical protein